jgi:hypothetical protein
MYRCKNSTIGFIIMIFRAVILKTPDKRCKLLEYRVFYQKKVLIYQDLRTGSGDNEIGGASNLAIISIKMCIF